MRDVHAEKVNLERIKVLTEILTSWLGAIALLLGGGFAVVQYMEKDKADRVKASMDFFERYNKPPFYDSRQRIERAWERNDYELNRILGVKPMDRQKYTDYVLFVIDRENIEYDVFQMIAFFESLEVCVKLSICDSAAALSFLQADARTLYRLHFSAINRARQIREDDTIAGELESFTRRK